jgi:hypothetical protein
MQWLARRIFNTATHLDEIRAANTASPRLELGGTRSGGKRFFLRCGQETFTLGLLAGGFTGAAYSFGLFAHALFRRLLIGAPRLHFTEDAFALHLLLQYSHGLFDIVVAYENLQFFS